MRKMTNFKSNKKQVLQELRKKQIAALHAIGAYVDGEAVVRCPVDTGNLRSSINHSVNEAERSVSIGTPVYYGIYIELGTYKMAEQPFLKPAVEQNISNIKGIASRYMGDD